MDMKTKKYRVLALLAVLVIGIVLTSGCMEQQKEQEGGTQIKTTNETQGETLDGTKAPSETPNKTQTPNEQPATETLSEILGRGTDISSVKYDIIRTSQGMPSMTQKIWLKKKKMRREIIMRGQTMIYLTDIDAKTTYMYMPAENKTIKKDINTIFKEATKPNLNNIFKETTEPIEGIKNCKPVVVGTGTIDGKVCIVCECTIKKVKIKSWIWKDKGFPIQTEMTTAEGNKIIIEYKNIEFANIPDSMFDLPAGVEIYKFNTSE